MSAVDRLFEEKSMDEQHEKKEWHAPRVEDEPQVILGISDAQALMDALWRAGVRPTSPARKEENMERDWAAAAQQRAPLADYMPNEEFHPPLRAAVHTDPARKPPVLPCDKGKGEWRWIDPERQWKWQAIGPRENHDTPPTRPADTPPPTLDDLVQEISDEAHAGRQAASDDGW